MTPEITLFTDLDAAAYEEVGLEWVRAVKSLSLAVAVIDHGLTDAQVEALEGMKHVRVVEPVVRTGCRPLDAWNTLAHHAAGPSGFCDASHRPTADALASWDKERVAAQVGTISPYKLLSPLVAIESRVRLDKAIKERVVAKLGGHLLPGLVLASPVGWRHLCGTGNLLIETGVTDNLPGLRALNLNLHAAYSAEVQVLKS